MIKYRNVFLLSLFFLFLSANQSIASDYWFAPPIQHTKENNIADKQIEGLIDNPQSWPETLGKIRVFKMYIYETSNFSDDLLKRLFQFLHQKNIQLALEMPPLTLIDANHCGWAVEGYAFPTQIDTWMQRIKINGGELSFVAMDEPVFYGSLFKGDASHPNPCRSSLEQIAADASQNLKIVRKYFPAAIIGDIEPLYSVANNEPPLSKVFVEWAKAYKVAMGEPLAFMHYDIMMSPELPLVIKSTISDLKRVGLRQGVILNGAPGILSDEEWFYSATGREDFIKNVLSDDASTTIIIQDWKPYPVNLIPENKPFSFTSFSREGTRERGDNPGPKAVYLFSNKNDPTNRSYQLDSTNPFQSGIPRLDAFYLYTSNKAAHQLCPLFKIDYRDAHGNNRSFYTIFEKEADAMVSDYNKVTKLVLGYVFDPQFTGGRAIYRAFNTKSNTYLFTASEEEFEALPLSVWRKDGVVFRFPRL